MPDIAFWNKCNNKCVMCTNMPYFARSSIDKYSLKLQIEKLERYLGGKRNIYWKNSDKADYVNLTGGEPTIHPEFFKLLAYFRRRMPKTPINLLTNGRRLADRRFLASLLKIARPPFGFIVPVHGPGPALHDGITGVTGSFIETMTGLENLFSMAPGRDIEIRLVLHRLTVRTFQGILRLLLKKFPDTARYTVVAIHYEIEGVSEKNHGLVALKLKDSAKAVAGAKGLIARFANFKLYHFPLCVLSPSLRKLARVTLPEEDRLYPAVCGSCSARSRCLGLMLEYYKAFGGGELKALKQKKSEFRSQ
ncbi:MAG: radical SAM protein [Elusimicrobia bacterium]|nr:radical SAM protein [Elusimicrobiota bacterium]